MDLSSVVLRGLYLRSAMATEGEEEVSDEQESETEDCDTEEDEGKTSGPIFMISICLSSITNYRQDQMEE